MSSAVNLINLIVNSIKAEHKILFRLFSFELQEQID